MSAEIRGERELYKALRRLGNAVDPDRIERVLVQAAELITEDAKARAPVKTGKLRDSIKVKVWMKRGAKTVVLAAVDHNIAPHSHLVEYGHKLFIKGRRVGRVRPKPFFRPAIDAKREQASQTIRDGIRRIIEEASH